MRTARILAILLTLAAMLAAAAYLFRLPLAGLAVRSAMTGAGLENAEARVTALSLSGIRLEDVAAGPASAPDISFEAVEADFHWRRLWAEKKADALRAGPGVVRVTIDEAGSVSVAGFKSGGGGGNQIGGALPLDRLFLQGVTLLVAAPEGSARGALDAEYDVAKGGAGAVQLEAERFTWSNIGFSDVKGAASADLSADGRISFAADIKGGAEVAGAALRNLTVKLEGEAASWRDVANGAADKLAGTARIAFSAPEVELRDAKAQTMMSAAQVQTAFGEKLHQAALSGALDIDFSEGVVTMRLAEGAPFEITTPDGSSMTLTDQPTAPFFASAGGRQNASFRFVLASEGVDASGGLDMELEGGAWRLAAPVEIAEFASEGLSLDGSRVDLSASSDGKNIEADIAVKSGLRRAEIGRLTIIDAPFSGAVRVKADMAGQRATITSKSDCFRIERARGDIKQYDLETRFTAMSLCNAEGPLGVITWNDEAAFALSGELSAKDANIRFGETRALGRPPAIRFDAAYHPAQHRTTLKGAAVNGAMTLNHAIEMSAMTGRFDFLLDAETMHGSADVDRLRVAQHLAEGQTLLVAPVIAAGKASLEGDKSRFTYTVTTPEGRRLGSGEGAHNMTTARGETAFSFGNLVFSRVGLQPNKIFPALKGIVDAAEGGMGGAIHFGWSPEGATSSADFDFQNISFGGPTRAVTRTSGVSGQVQLTDLLPITTDGLQNITVSAVDLDALQLNSGVLSFEFPGDETVRLERGEFPWFGGTLGVYDATASFAGEAQIPLRAEQVDIKQVLDYAQVEGLSGEGLLSGALPLVLKDGKARIVDGVLRSEGPGAIRYVGAAGAQAEKAGQNAEIAFDFLRDLRYKSLEVTVNGALDGELEFSMRFEGAGDVTVSNRNFANVPVLYRINLYVENIDLLRKANLSRDIKMRIERALEDGAK